MNNWAGQGATPHHPADKGNLRSTSSKRGKKKKSPAGIVLRASSLLRLYLGFREREAVAVRVLVLVLVLLPVRLLVRLPVGVVEGAL